MKVELSRLEKGILADALWRVDCEEDGGLTDFDCPFWNREDEECNDQCAILFKKLGQKWGSKRAYWNDEYAKDIVEHAKEFGVKKTAKEFDVKPKIVKRYLFRAEAVK